MGVAGLVGRAVGVPDVEIAGLITDMATMRADIAAMRADTKVMVRMLTRIADAAEALEERVLEDAT